MPATFPNGLPLAIQRSRMTVSTIARYSKLSEHDIESWASGQVRLPAEAAQRLACVLKVTIADLMYGPPAASN